MGIWVNRQKIHCIVILSTPYHSLRFKELKFSSPFRVEGLELNPATFCILLALGQSALLEESPGMVIGLLRVAGTRIFERNEEKKDRRPSE